ncbi:glutamate dehydrogenase [Pseudochelatococcus lubricantis]|uniref:Glutamate dehydrogenase n=1 Tax=Pseudochelatococcus lubricantis TaxID=1538102 RepID=A0ABX0V2M7_9HYPH|nr:glutamate dehydrogenase [Pseudochelatococcus lubricantis]
MTVSDLIARVEGGLSEEGASAPGWFVEALLGQVAAEDLTVYPETFLAALVEEAFGHLTQRRLRGQPSIRLTDHETETTTGARQITVVEIVNDNRPFLLDSTLAAVVDLGFEPLLVAHPIIEVARDETGGVLSVRGEAGAEVPPAGVSRESLIHIHLPRIEDEEARERLADELTRVYADVSSAVGDWPAMRARLVATLTTLRETPPPLPGETLSEAVAFLQWLVDDNFTFLGIREYRFRADTVADPVAGTGLGILRDPDMRVLRRGRELVVMTQEIREFLQKPVALIIAKANVKSRVHRRVHLDYIGVKLFDDVGEVVGELRIVGLFTGNAYTQSTTAIPYLRQKVAEVVRRAEFDPASYSGRALLHVLDDYPRDELFQIDVGTLYDFAHDILRLTERPRVRVLSRLDEFGRFVSVLVYVPKDRYNTDTRAQIGAFLTRLYQGRLSATYPSYPAGPLARIHYIIGRDDGDTPVIDRTTLEAGIASLIRTWGDSLREALSRHVGGARGRQLAVTYGEAFGGAYREAFSGEAVIDDIAGIEALAPEHPRAVKFYRREGDPEMRVGLKVFSRGAPTPLSERVPLLEKLGFRVVNERTYRVVPRGAEPEARVWLHDMTLERAAGGAINIERAKAELEAALIALFEGQAESDGFNVLVLEASLGWRDAAILRAYGRYLRQIGAPFGQEYLAQTLAHHPEITARLVALIGARFNPDLDGGEDVDRAARETEVRADIETRLQGVSSLDEDRILRRFANLIAATVRTNIFQRGAQGGPRDTIAFKFECAKVEGLPKPVPLYEIFVYSPRVEGVHLRFGKVARGGLRWSDRPQDFRTEVLGLVKAQQVKNAVIVPVGAKGGFVPKRLPPASDRAAWLEEGRGAYRVFIASLLDLTDNRAGTEIVPPPRTVRHDGDDPYLVVAADKGTATFSDLANEISLEHGHWLGDAFASGGSNGYDHKGMGITARGAWEAVKRHFREIDIDIQTTPVTVAGVGDMSGDVFGNGMLLSQALKLVAAFDHRDIFLDPDPDPATAWAERKRLFELPRSSWQDYDRGLISTGGGVFSRSAKTIPLSEQVRARLGIDKAEATPQELISAILRASVDLLWFGGIGTYIRASGESDDKVGDRANDSIRIAGRDVRARVIGEGANLGVTQQGRIEAARRGVRINTDAIDNSAGVNTSDVEVNLKIALSIPESDGRLSGEERNALLAQMTPEVAQLVLVTNYEQPRAISLMERRGAGEIGYARRFIQVLEAAGRLDRAIEYLPDDAELAAREKRGEGLTRPEIAVLLAYAKLALYDAILESGVPDDPYVAHELEQYFPPELGERFPDAIEHHRLRREIIATRLSNAIINHAGATIVTKVADQTGADAPTLAAAYIATWASLGLDGIVRGIDALDARIGAGEGAVSGATQLALYADVQDMLVDRLVWFSRNVDFSAGGIEAVVTRYRAGVEAIGHVLDTTAGAEAPDPRVAELLARNVPEAVAEQLGRLEALVEAPDIVRTAARAGHPVEEVARVHLALADVFAFNELAQAGRDISLPDYYDRLALERAVTALADAHVRLTSEIVADGEGAGDEAVAQWQQRRAGDVARIRDAVDNIRASGLTLSRLIVAASLVGDLARG